MNPTTLLLVQLAVILGAARLCGAVLQRSGQPPVIGEMAAGLLLGPIAFGAWLPELHTALFAAKSLPPLSGLATMGVVLFMFVVGVELRAAEGTKAQVRASLLVGLSGIVLPLLLGWQQRPGCSRASHRRQLASGRSPCSSPRRCRSPRFRCWRASSRTAT